MRWKREKWDERLKMSKRIAGYIIYQTTTYFYIITFKIDFFCILNLG